MVINISFNTIINCQYGVVADGVPGLVIEGNYINASRKGISARGAYKPIIRTNIITNGNVSKQDHSYNPNYSVSNFQTIVPTYIYLRYLYPINFIEK